MKKFEESGDPKDEPKKFLKEKVMNGDLGVKTGKASTNTKRLNYSKSSSFRLNITSLFGFITSTILSVCMGNG